MLFSFLDINLHDFLSIYFSLNSFEIGVLLNFENEHLFLPDEIKLNLFISEFPELYNKLIFNGGILNGSSKI